MDLLKVSKAGMSSSSSVSQFFSYQFEVELNAWCEFHSADKSGFFLVSLH